LEIIADARQLFDQDYAGNTHDRGKAKHNRGEIDRDCKNIIPDPKATAPDRTGILQTQGCSVLKGQSIEIDTASQNRPALVTDSNPRKWIMQASFEFIRLLSLVGLELNNPASKPAQQ